MVDRREKGRDWSWLPAQMPVIADMIAAKRKEYGDAHVNLCWQRGIKGVPGWFFAREGPIAIGTPDKVCQGLNDQLVGFAGEVGHTMPYLYIRVPEAQEQQQ